MFAQYDFNDTALMIIYLLIALAIPGIVMLFDNAKMHER
jgi:hypothetical protein